MVADVTERLGKNNLHKVLVTDSRAIVYSHGTGSNLELCITLCHRINGELVAVIANSVKNTVTDHNALVLCIRNFFTVNGSKEFLKLVTSLKHAGAKNCKRVEYLKPCDIGICERRRTDLHKRGSIYFCKVVASEECLLAYVSNLRSYNLNEIVLILCLNECLSTDVLGIGKLKSRRKSYTVETALTESDNVTKINAGELVALVEYEIGELSKICGKLHTLQRRAACKCSHSDLGNLRKIDTLKVNTHIEGSCTYLLKTRRIDACYSSTALRGLGIRGEGVVTDLLELRSAERLE